MVVWHFLYMHLISSYADDGDNHLHHQHWWCWWWRLSSSSSSSLMMLTMTMTMMCGMTLLLHLIQALALDSLPLNSSPPPLFLFLYLQIISRLHCLVAFFSCVSIKWVRNSMIKKGQLEPKGSPWFQHVELLKKTRLCILASEVSAPGTQL